MAIKTRRWTETGTDKDGKPYRTRMVEYKCDQCLSINWSDDPFCFTCAFIANGRSDRAHNFYAKYGLNK